MTDFLSNYESTLNFIEPVRAIQEAQSFNEFFTALKEHYPDADKARMQKVWERITALEQIVVDPSIIPEFRGTVYKMLLAVYGEEDSQSWQFTQRGDLLGWWSHPDLGYVSISYIPAKNQVTVTFNDRNCKEFKTTTFKATYSS
jgi:hypothetical protein